jgi:hypothetical protein
MNRRERIERIIDGVLRQAAIDAGTSQLRVDEASKTHLLLGLAAAADIYPRGDLYCSQVMELYGSAEVPELASEFGGIETLDTVLARYFDLRLPWPVAAEALGEKQRETLADLLDAARFRRMRTGLVPKLGARTLGIDLFA